MEMEHTRSGKKELKKYNSPEKELLKKSNKKYYYMTNLEGPMTELETPMTELEMPMSELEKPMTELEGMMDLSPMKHLPVVKDVHYKEMDDRRKREKEII